MIQESYLKRACLLLRYDECIRRNFHGKGYFTGKFSRTQGETMESFTYILRCADGSLYTGWTNDLAKRLSTHNAGRGAKYTRTRRPVALVYWERFPTKQAAMSREWAIKQLSRQEKLALIRTQGGDGQLP